MEGWLAELEMDIKPVITLDHNSYQQCHQSGTMEAFFDEQLAATLVEDFPYPLLAEGDTPSPQWEFDYNVIEQLTAAVSAPQVLSNSEYHDVNNSNNNNNNNVNESKTSSIEDMMSSNVEAIEQQFLTEKKTKKQGSSGGRKRKRQPSQVQEHILAERKRRELLSQLFVSLSAIVPGLKKMGKTSILGEAIKYVKQLQEKVKILEEVAAKRTVESRSIVIVKKSQLIVDDNNDGGNDNNSSCTVDYQSPSGSGGCNLNSGGSREAEYLQNSLPEIEVKLSGNALLLRIYCEEQKQILDTLLAELNKHGMIVTNCSVIPFDNFALDITIAAKMMEMGFNFNVNDFVRSLYFALRLNSHQCRASSPNDHSS